VITDAAHPSHGFAFGGFDADGQAVWNGENLGLDAVSHQNPIHAFLYPEGLRTAHGQLVA
jgi:hypothetical protein